MPGRSATAYDGRRIMQLSVSYQKMSDTAQAFPKQTVVETHKVHVVRRRRIAVVLRKHLSLKAGCTRNDHPADGHEEHVKMQVGVTPCQRRRRQRVHMPANMVISIR